MAKKAVASFKKGDGRTYSKVIKMVKSPKTGAYIFQEEMVPNEAVKDYFAKQLAKHIQIKPILKSGWVLFFNNILM